MENKPSSTRWTDKERKQIKEFGDKQTPPLKTMKAVFEWCLWKCKVLTLGIETAEKQKDKK